MLRIFLITLCGLPSLLFSAEELRFQLFWGSELAGHVQEIVQLTHALYCEPPYCYNASDAGYERHLKAYGQSDEAILCLAYDGDRPVGLAVGVPLIASRSSSIEPLGRGESETFFYLGEFGLLPGYRSPEIELQLYEEIERAAREQAPFRAIVMWELCNPVDALPICKAAGFSRAPYPTFAISWVRLGESEATSHEAEYWIKPLR